MAFHPYTVLDQLRHREYIQLANSKQQGRHTFDRLARHAVQAVEAFFRGAGPGTEVSDGLPAGASGRFDGRLGLVMNAISLSRQLLRRVIKRTWV